MSVCVMQKWPGNLPALPLQQLHALDPSYASCLGGTWQISCVPVQGDAKKGSVHSLEKEKEKEKLTHSSTASFSSDVRLSLERSVGSC